jgi:CRISPR-associated protein Cmr1
MDMETTLVLRLETPLLINFVDPDWPLRPHEVWRLWRWWAKALVAGALFDRGFLHGAEQQTAVKTPTQEETECILQIVERKMKLDAHDTCFQIRFEEIDFAPPREAAPSFEIQYGIRRHEKRNVRQRDGALWHIDRGSAALVVKERDPCFIDGEAIEAAMGALALAMRLSCFGEGGRRGLGCFYVRAHGRYRTLFEEEPAALIRRAVAAAGAIVDDAVFRCRIYRRQASPCGLPPMRRSRPFSRTVSG